MPYSSLASRSRRNAAAWLRWRELPTLTFQSKARPSLCSEVPPALHARLIPRLPELRYLCCSQVASFTVPGLGRGSHLRCSWTGANHSIWRPKALTAASDATGAVTALTGASSARLSTAGSRVRQSRNARGWRGGVWAGTLDSSEPRPVAWSGSPCKHLTG